MAKRVIEVEIVGDADKLKRSFQQAGGATDQFADKQTKAGGKMQKFGAMAKGAALGGIGALVTGLKSSVTAARDAEVSQTRMETQLKALGISYKGHAGEIDTVIQKTSKLAGLDDEDLSDAFTKIVRSTGDVDKGLKGMAMSADIARGSGKKICSSLGSYREGSRWTRHGARQARGHQRQGQGLHRDPGRSSEEVCGQAKAYGESAAGGQDRLKVAFENLMESVGKGLLPVLTVLANSLANLMGWFEKHKTIAIALGVVIGALAGTLIAMKVAALSSELGDGRCHGCSVAMERGAHS